MFLPLFCSARAFPFVVTLSLKSSLHQRFSTRQDGCIESCSRLRWSISARLTVSPATQLVKSSEASFRTQGTSLVSTASQLVAMLSVARMHSVEQPIGTWKMSITFFSSLFFIKDIFGGAFLCLSLIGQLKSVQETGKREKDGHAAKGHRVVLNPWPLQGACSTNWTPIVPLFLKPKYQVKEMCEKFSQTTWITKCWKLVMEFLPDDKDKVLARALSKGFVLQKSYRVKICLIMTLPFSIIL